MTELDFRILDFTREHFSSGPMDAAMKFFTFLGEAGWFWILIGIVLAAIPKSRRTGVTELAALLLRLIRASFNQRRKTLINGLGNAEGLAVTKAEAAEALSTLGIPENVRGEALSLEQFARLSDLLGKKGAAQYTQQCTQSDRQEESES